MTGAGGAGGPPVFIIGVGRVPFDSERKRFAFGLELSQPEIFRCVLMLCLSRRRTTDGAGT